MLFQLLVIVNNVQTMAEPLFKQHEKTSRLIILWFQKYLVNEKKFRSSKPITNCWDAPLGWLWLHTFIAHTKGMVSDMCRQTINVILEQELQHVLNSK